MPPSEIMEERECVCGHKDWRVPRGYCHCGCGEKTRVCLYTYAPKRQFAGVPLRYIPKHQLRTDKFWNPKPETPLASQQKITAYPPEELAWAAGFFEGEGTIAIMRPNTRNYGSLCVSIANTDLPLLQFFKQRWGGTIRRLKSLKGNRKPAWRWLLSSRQAVKYLLAIKPYAYGWRMKERIFLGIAFQDNKWEDYPFDTRWSRWDHVYDGLPPKILRRTDHGCDRRGLGRG